jgi:hypothetical protein
MHDQETEAAGLCRAGPIALGQLVYGRIVEINSAIPNWPMTVQLPGAGQFVSGIALHFIALQFKARASRRAAKKIKSLGMVTAAAATITAAKRMANWFERRVNAQSQLIDLELEFRHLRPSQ